MGLLITKNIKQENIYLHQQQQLINGGINYSHSKILNTNHQNLINISNYKLIFNGNH